ncbi:24-dehydrocholesterol reductase precursor [Paraphaeosphaeria minitans]|uniref:24-dehydrocholesterol reductase n=1 Tax=Paraphaeosphaeria minitans TaxID=565426 RepID=A0A9P6G3W5_9PLEO|nr:24-dehydrocholesterol reductase precursor [Paraphaeosphaeria minitans]
MLTVFEYDPKPWEQHRSAVAALRRTIEETGQIRPSSSFRAQRAAFNAPSDVPGFDKIVQLDFDTSTAWVEPNVTMGTLVQATLECGFVPAVVAGSKTISVADAFAATTTESSSFMFGTFDCTVLSMEVILSNGQYVMARSDDKDTADLLWGSAGALHSLGLTTLLEIALIPAGGYVEVMYSPIFSISGARCMMQQIERGPSGPPLSMLDLSTDFVEVIMFDSSSGLAITGRFTPTTGRASVLQSLKGNSFSRHARSVWYDSRLAYKRRVEILPVMEYLFRHDDRHPQARRKRRSWGQKSSANFGDESSSAVLQDIGLPAEATEEHIRNFHEAQGIWPIWMYPVRPPESFGRCSFGTGAPFAHMFWNIRFSSSSAACDGAMERRLRNAQGFRYLHCRAPCSEATAWVFHDDRWYGELRSRWSAQGLPDRFVDNWLTGGEDPELTNLVTLLDALDLLKTATKQKILDRQGTAAAQVQSNTVFRHVNENASSHRGSLERRSTNRAPKRIRPSNQGQDLPDFAPCSATVSEEAASSSFRGPQFLGDEASFLRHGNTIPIATFPSSSREAPMHAAEQMDDRDPVEGELSELSYPHFFLEAFEASGFEPATNDQASERTMLGQMHERGCHNYADDPAFQHYLDLACCSDFRLPHEPVAYLNRTQVSQLLLPLIEEIPLSVHLIRGLFYALLPGPLHILELNLENCTEGLSTWTESAENFAAIILRESDTPPLLVLGDGTTRTIFVIASDTERPPFLLPLNLPSVHGRKSALIRKLWGHT